MNTSNKLLVIAGPTGTGKTGLAINLAEKFKGEVISADSRQVYIDMDIGTGKEVKDLKKGLAQKGDKYWSVRGIKVHLYDVVSPKEKFSLVDFQESAVSKIEEIRSEGKLPILAGGTGLYIQSIVDGLKIPKAPPDQNLRNKLEGKSISQLYQELLSVDPLAAKKLDVNNPRRIIRALEVFYQTGQSIEILKEKYQPNFNILMVGLTGKREFLYQANDERIEEWFELGFVEEVKNLLKQYDPTLPSLSALGYQHIKLFLDGKLTLEEAKQKIKYAMHNFIRKQIMWFKRDQRIFWFDVKEAGFTVKVEELVKAWYT